MATTVIHDPSEGVLCWGGPEHEHVVPIPADKTVIEFPVMRRVTTAVPDPTWPYISKVLYRVHRWGARYDDGSTEEWRVLIYAENEERLLANFAATTAVIQWMVCPWRPNRHNRRAG